MLLLGIGLAGFLGAIARYSLGGYISRKSGGSFPIGTLVINVSGALLLGLLTGLGMGKGSAISPAWRTVLGAGFLGAYTTFSTWELETANLLSGRKLNLAWTNLALSTTAGLLAAAAGLYLGRTI